MRTLVAGKVATVVDSMFKVKINYSPFRGSILMRFKMSKPQFILLALYYSFNPVTNKRFCERLKSSDFFYSINPRSIYAIFWSEQKEKKSFEGSRSFPGYASVILASALAPLHCAVSIHVTCVYVYRYNCNLYTMYKSNLYMNPRSFDLPDVTHIRSRMRE